MNPLHIREIEENIEKIYGAGGFAGKEIILFGANKPSEMILRALQSRGLTASAIVDNNPAVSGRTMQTIKIGLPEDILGHYRDNVIILIASRYYPQMKAQLMALQYKEEQIRQVLVYQTLSSGEEAFAGAVEEVRQGAKIHARLQTAFGRDVKVIMCPYNGIGDMYFIASYLEAYLQKEQIKNYVVTVVSNGCLRVARMFGIPRTEKLSQRESDSLLKFAAFLGEEQTGVRVLTHNLFHWDILIQFEIPWGVMFRQVLMKTGPAAKRCPVVFPQAAQETERLFEEHHLVPGKTAILSPYANTIVGLEDELWLSIVRMLRQKGYGVYTNSAGRQEPALPGTEPISFSLEAARQVVERAGVFIGLRSGLCDVIEAACAKVFILYPDRKMMFFNLKDMGFGQTAREYCCRECDAAGEIARALEEDAGKAERTDDGK